jgi:tRNA1(Val) A37 N6-methylase TrmN6
MTDCPTGSAPHSFSPVAPDAPATTEDAFLGGAVRVRQPKSGYRAGLDAVLLAASVELAHTDPVRVLDCGSGVGVVGLCLAWRLKASAVTLVEQQGALVDMARHNIAANGFDPRMRVVHGDITDRLSKLTELAGEAEAFDHVVANPPYYDVASGTLAQDPSRAAAHAMATGSLDAWARFMAAMAKPRGTITLVHRADGLSDILRVFEARFGAIRIKPIQPRAAEPAGRILVQARKGSRAPLEICPPLVLYDQAGATQPDVDAILRAGASLRWIA